jgi:hypothetical protein
MYFLCFADVYFAQAVIKIYVLFFSIHATQRDSKWHLSKFDGSVFYASVLRKFQLYSNLVLHLLVYGQVTYFSSNLVLHLLVYGQAIYFCVQSKQNFYCGLPKQKKNELCA